MATRARHGHSDRLLELLLLGGLGYAAWQSMGGKFSLPSLPSLSLIQLPSLTAELPTSISHPSNAGNVANAPSGAPIGIRNNNPGNIRPSLIPWIGQIGTNGGFAAFDTPAHGIRAIFKNLKSYINSHGLHTIPAIASRWTATQQTAWASNVARFSGISPNEAINPNDFLMMGPLAHGIVGAENGAGYVNYYAPDVFIEAWSMS